MSIKWKSDPNLRTIIENAISTTNSMSQAAVKIGMKLDTLRHYAKLFGIWKPNMGLKGISKSHPGIDLQEILDGKHPQLSAMNIKRKLFKSGLKTNRCEECSITDWCGKPIMCQLDHINGDRFDHRLENLRILCPNCHSQTSTFAGRNSSCRSPTGRRHMS